MTTAQIASCAALLLVGRAMAKSDVTFFMANDMHFVYNESITQCHEIVINDMHGIVGSNYPAAVGGGIVDAPRALTIAGDVTETGASTAYDVFTNWYGLTGTEGRFHYPVCEGWGNHDSGTATKNGMRGRNPQRTFLPNLKIYTNGLHYSWDWENVHFVQLNKYPGDTDGTTTKPEYSYDFLANDLATNVGNSGRLVVLIHHYGLNAFGLSWWPTKDQDDYYNLIKDYNVIAIIHGHSHGQAIYQWNGIDVFNPQTASGKEVINPGYMICHIMTNKFVIASRIYTTNTATWAWSINFSKTITNVPPPGTVNNAAGASNVTMSSALLVGDLAAANADSTYAWIYWGKTDGGTTKTAWANAESIGAIVTGIFTRSITSLQSETNYFYRCYASNVFGGVWAPSSTSFAAKAWLEVGNGVGATGVTTTAAVLNGALLETNAPNNYTFFYWGTTDGGTNTAAWANVVPMGLRTPGAFSSTLTNLVSSTQYYYRTCGTNSMGRKWASSSVAFRTADNLGKVVVAKTLLIEAIANKTAHTNTAGEVAEWLNTGSVGGVFTTAFSSTLPTKATVGGVGCLTFDGVDDALKSTFLSPTGITANSDWSVELWANNPAIMNDKEIMLSWSHLELDLQGAAFSYGNMRPTAETNGYAWDTAFTHYRDNGQIFLKGAPSAGTWHHLVYTFSNTLLRIYADGVLDCSRNLALNVLDTKPVHVGGALRYNANDQPYYFNFSGSLAAIRVHDGTLSEEQIQHNYLGGPMASTAGGELQVWNGGGASAIDMHSASLDGVLVSTDAAPTYVYVYWGASDGGTSKTAWTSASAMGSLGLGGFSTNVAGLTPNTVYYYRCYASNSLGTAWSAVSATFTTMAGAPVISNTAATSVTPTNAVLNGIMVSTGAAPATAWVYWGTTDGGTNPAAWYASIPLGGRTNSPIATTLPGLTYGTAYYYAYYATNSYGGTWAVPGASFTTPIPPLAHVDITNLVGGITVDVSVTTYVLKGTNNASTAGTVVWTNSLGGNGAFPAAATGWAFTASLSMGNNVITVYGTNEIGMLGQDSVTISALPPLPYVDVTNVAGSVVVPPSTTTWTIKGTNSAATVGLIGWANALGGAGTFPAGATGWTFAASVTTGDNVIVVTGTNATGNTHQDSVTVSVAAVSVTNRTATGVTFAGATANGWLHNWAAGVPATVILYWGTTDGGTTPGNWQTNAVVGSGVPSGALTKSLAGLTQTTTYYYTFFATNAVDAKWASNGSRSFTTLLDMGLDAVSINVGANGTFTNRLTGVAYTGDWNHILGVSNPSAAPGALTNNFGNAVPSLSVNFTGAQNTFNSNGDPGHTLFSGFLSGNPMQVIVSNIPYTTYDVYVYLNGFSAGNSNVLTWTATDLGTAADVATLYFARGTLNSYTIYDGYGFVQDQYASLAEAEGAVAADDCGNYLKFSGLTASNLKIARTASRSGNTENGFTGIQIVKVWDDVSPVVDVTNDAVTVANTVTNYAVAGTKNANVVGYLWVSNATAGGAAQSFAATASWTSPAVPLAVGANTITVCGTNTAGTVAGDSVVITRQSLGGAYVDITNANASVANGVANYSLGGTNNLYTVGVIVWTNSLGGNGAVPAGSTGWVFSVPLTVGANVVTAYGTNTAGDTSSDSVTITRQAAAVPYVDITNASVAVANSVTSYTLGGTNNANVVGTITWTNTLDGAGIVPAHATGWVFTVPLAVGANMIIARGTNDLGTAHSDTVTVTRMSAGGSNYNWSTFLAAAFRTNWNMAANWSGVGFPNSIDDRANSYYTNTGFGGNQFIDLGQDITVGSFYMFDMFNLRRLLNAGNKLTFQHSSGTSYLMNYRSGGTLGIQFYADMQFNNDLVVTAETTRACYFGGVISGTGRLTLHFTSATGSTGTNFFFTTTKSTEYNACPGGAPNNNTNVNTYSGGSVFNGTVGGLREVVMGDKQGAFGTGSIWLNPHISLRITDGGTPDNRIADTASLYLSNNTGVASIIVLDASVNETVGGLYTNGMPLAPGTYGATGSGAGTILDTYFSGSGILTVTNTTPSASPSDVEQFAVGRGADYGQVALSWSNGNITVLWCTNRLYSSSPSSWSILSSGVSSPWTHTAASNFPSAYYRIVSASFTSRYDVGKFDVDVAAGSIAWLSFPFGVQLGCDMVSEWFGQQLEARHYGSFNFPSLQRQTTVGGTIEYSDYYVNGGVTNWNPDSTVAANVGYVLFLPQNHGAVKITGIGMVQTNNVTMQVPYNAIPWLGLAYDVSIDMRQSGLTNMLQPPRLYSSFNYDFVASQQTPGGPAWYAEYYQDNWGTGAINFFPSATGADKLDAGKAYLLFFSTSRSGTGVWTCTKPY